DVARKHVRGALQAPKIEAKSRRQATRGEGLAEPRHIFEEHVTTGENRRQRDLNRIVHADNGCSHRSEDVSTGLGDRSVSRHCFSLFGESASMATNARSMS